MADVDDLFSMSFPAEQRDQLMAALAFSFCAAPEDVLRKFYAVFGPFEMKNGCVETKKNKLWLHSLVFDGLAWWLRTDDGALTSFDDVHPYVRKSAALAADVVQDFIVTMLPGFAQTLGVSKSLYKR